MTPLYHSMLLSLDVLGIAAFLTTLAWAWHKRFVIRLRDVRLFFLVWSAAFLLEYYVLGPYSFIQMDEAGEMFVPLFKYLNTRFLGGQFAHHLGSGVDVTIYQTGSQLFSVDVALFGLLPVWLAILVHKMVVLAVALIGTYVLCRRSVSADRATAAFTAAFFTVSGEYMNHMTFAWGAAFAFAPWLFYVIVVRADKPHYYRWVLPPVILSTLFASPTNWVLPNFAAIAFGAVLFGRYRWRIAISLVIYAIAVFIVWGDVLYGMFVTALYTGRGSAAAEVAQSVGSLIAEIGRDTWGHLCEDRYLFIGFVLLPVLWFRRDPLRLSATAALLGPILLYWAMRLFPWEAVGFKAFRQVSQHHVLVAESILYLPLIARGAALLPRRTRGGSWRPAPSAAPLALALALSLFAYYKGLNYVNFLYHSGQAAYSTVDTVVRQDWRPAEPFRVITVRAPDIGTEPELAAGFYGLSAYDFYLNLKPTQHSTFWSTVMGGNPDQRMFIDWSKWRDGRYHISEQFDVARLGLANIGAVISPVPIESTDLTLAIGPSQPPITRDEIRSRPKDYVLERLHRLVDFNDLYVYRLNRYLPIAFVADHVATLPKDAAPADIIDRLAAAQGSRVALVGAADAAIATAAAASLRVGRTEEVRDGYRVEVDAPHGGVLVLNTPWLPFWSAEASGQTLTPVSANLIHLAVPVPAGANVVTFRYHRPDLRDLVARAIPLSR